MSRDAKRSFADLNGRFLSLQGLYKAYRATSGVQYVLRDVSLQVEQGEFVVILGVSGSGKTTLLNLIGGMDQPESGELQVCGTRLSNASETELARFRRDCIGFVFQSYNLAHLEAVGLAEKADSLPEQLSGGEQQRVAVARALAKRPPLVLADEPTGNLDRDTAREIWRLMHRLNRETGVTFLVVTHDPAAAEKADRVFRIEQGSLCAVPWDSELHREAANPA
jgi:ABC-type lipoprotein export system ATPase subunit